MTMKTSHVHVLNNKGSKNDEMGGWNSLLSLPPKKDVETGDYVVKPSKRTLSQNSLEMCTETLGSETGSESREEFSSFSGERETSRDPSLKPRRCFPPPLPSINGSGGVRVKRHREDGRLVVMVLTAASPQAAACFQAERENGRLKLRFTEYTRDGGFEGEEMEMEMEGPVPGSNCKEDDHNIKGEMVNVEALLVATS